MKKATINALADLGALVVFIPSLISGLVLYLVLPEGGGYRGGAGTTGAQIYLGIVRGAWKDLHNDTSLIFAALIILHLLLHIPYFRNIGKTILRDRTINDAP